MTDSSDHYELLGVDADAPAGAIQRAHRRQAVIEHRRGIFRLEKHLRRMGEVARNLIDPERRRRYDEHRLLSRTALHRPPTEEEVERTKRVGMRLHGIRREIGDASVRMSLNAVSAHADAMRQVGEEHASRERRQKQALARRAFVSKLIRVSLYVTLVALVVYFWSRR